jgi:hypothetical protein
MNGHTYLRTYRVLMFLGMASFLYTAFATAIPEDFETEEYTFDHLGEQLFDSLKIGYVLHPSMLCKTGHLPIIPKSTAYISTK